MHFGRATFSGGEVYLNGATFSGGEVSFRSAAFSGGLVNFGSATFSGGEVSFRNPRGWCLPRPSTGPLMSPGRRRASHCPAELALVTGNPSYSGVTSCRSTWPRQLRWADGG